MLNGSVPAEWLAPFEGNVITSIEGFHRVHTADMAARTLALCRLPEEAAEEPAAEPAPAEAPLFAAASAPVTENPLFDEDPAPAAPARPRGNFCPECGAPVEDYYIFCGECGTRL